MTNDLTPTITDDQVRALPLDGSRADLLRGLLTDTGAVVEPQRGRRRWLAPLVAAAVLAVAVPVGLWQLDDGKTGRDVQPGGPAPAAPASFQIRVVGASSVDEGIDADQRAQLEAFSCPPAPVLTVAADTQLACDDQGIKYLLEPAVVDGGIVAATAEIPQGQVAWVVTLQLDDVASEAITEVSSELVGTTGQVGLLVDGELLSAPTFGSVVDTGSLQISGDFTQADAEAMAARLGAQGE
jgi:preprotein translocase subunit SecD